MGLRTHRYFAALITVGAMFFSPPIKAQKIDTISTFSIAGYIDAYYAYYTDSVGPANYQKFPTVSPRSNSPGLNMAQVALQYTAEKIRGTAVFHYGDMAQSTWSTQFNNIQEAHVGFKVCRKLWIDGGFFRTHFGTEMLMPVENITSSVSVATYHEPYYESGFRLNFDPTSKLEINVYLLNGYNIYVDNNNKKSAGLVVTYAINDNAAIGYNNYMGDDSQPTDPVSHFRFHNNLNFNYQKNKLKIQVGGDYCVQQNSDLATGKAAAGMYSGLLTARYQCTGKFAVYARGEVFADPDGYMSTIFIDNKGKKTGYKLWGVTAGAEIKPTPESYVRLEGRMLQMDQDQEIFYNDGKPQSSRMEIMINAGVTFDLLKRFGTRASQ